MKKSFLFAMMLCCAQLLSAQQERIDLSGTWRFQADPMGFGKTPGSELYQAKLTESIMLPGSTDEGGKGMLTTARYVDRLTRKFEYCGQAWYQREVIIPEEWKDKEITLNLERCHWETTVYVDGKEIGAKEHLSVPNRFLLSKQMTPGMHILTICVDNRLKYPMDQWNHGTTEYTQTNWNGIVGKIELTAYEKTNIHALKAYPDIETRTVTLDITVNNTTGQPTNGLLQLVINEKGGKTVSEQSFPITLKEGSNQLIKEISMGKNIKLWNEFTPYLYEVKAMLTADNKQDSKNITFGMREVTQGKHHIQINGRNVHLRGALDCCVFPLTGYPSTTIEDWKRIFLTVKDYGMNHIRFHSWCPPEAAFHAADEVGIYLQAELPMWIKDVGQYPARRDFFEKEMYAILEEYGNHPSFILMCNGNENEGNFNVLEDLVKKAQKHDNRRLYSASTARTHTPSDQYYVSHVTEKGWITVYEGKPSTDWDRKKESDIDCPVIAHETGQRCMYPNFAEMEKYTGVVSPRNFEVFRERLDEKGLLPLAEDYFKCSGKLAVQCYKEEMEAVFRSRLLGGFQILDIQDFSGQGTALVGVLDAFMDSKELITDSEWREFCNDAVVMARFDSYVLEAVSSFKAHTELCNYRPDLKDGKLICTLTLENGDVIGKVEKNFVAEGNYTDICDVEFTLPQVTKNTKAVLALEIDGTDIRNHYDLWVIPTVEKTDISGAYIFDEVNAEAESLLKQGKTVLIVPDLSRLENSIEGFYCQDFWCYHMFCIISQMMKKPDPVGTMGLLIDTEHPALAGFAGEKYSTPQWWEIVQNSRSVILDDFKGEKNVIVRTIDNFDRNHDLSLLYEYEKDGGKVVVCSCDFDKLSHSPEGRAFIKSVVDYVRN